MPSARPAFLFALILSACADGAARADDARGIEFAPPAPEELAWPDPVLAAGRARYVRFNGPWAHVTYGRFLAQNGARAEIVYGAAVDGDYVVEIPFGLRRALGRFAWLEGRVRDVGPERDADAGWRRPYYRRFRAGRDNRACVAFMAAWDVRGLDQQGRPGKAAFGYYCAPPGRRLPRRRIDLLLSGIDFRDAETRGSKPLAGNDPAALAFARTGVPRFPFDFGKTVREGRGDRRRP